MALFFYKEKNKDIRAAAYLRLSIEDGDKAESNSIGNQRELIRDFAAERPGLHLVEEYADDGYTGTNFERPGFKRMMEDIKSGKINCIIVKDLSRLGRNYIEMGKYLEQIFPMMGIRFIAINDNYDNANSESSDSDSIVVPFKNLLNDSYCRDISIKVRSQLDMKRRKGEFIGGYAIYGYCKDKRNKNRLVVDEYAADIVRSIYRRKLEGMSAQAIAEQLNSENVLAPSEYKRLCGLNYHSGFKAGTHAKWQAIQVLRILKNEVYTGTMVQGRRQKINYKIKKIRDVEESGWIRVPNMHEAIIPQKLFDTVQEVLKLDTCASKGQQTVNLFSGIVRCGGCGQNMVRRTVSKNGKKYIYLHCVTNHNGLGCSSHLISESKLAEVVLAALQGKVQQISGLEHRLDEINEIPKNERRLKSVEEHLKMLEQEEQKYQTLRRQLYEDMSSGIVSKEKISTTSLLGYDTDDDGEMVIVTNEAEIVRTIYMSFDKGMHPAEIAEKLNALEIRTIKNNPWTGESVKNILRNEKYCGDVLMQKTYTVDCLTHKTKKNEGEVEQYFIPDHHPAIVEREVWDKAQVRLEQIAGKRRRIRPKQQRLVPLRKGVLLGFVPIRPTWKAVSFKRLETATEKVMALVDAKPEQVHIEYESEECEMEILKGFEVINLKQPKGESVMTVTSNSLKFNKATAVELNYAPYIKVLLNAKTRQIAIQPCSEKDPNAIKFSNEESKQTYAISIKVPAIQVEFRRMLPFEDDNGGKLSYTLNGTLYPDEQVVIYDIGDVKPETEKKRRGRRKKSEIEAEQKEN